MPLSSLLGALSGLMALVAYGFYFRQAVKGQSTPNPSSWGIWLFAGIINAFTYFSVVGGNIWQSLFVMAVTFSVCVVFIYSLFKGRFTKVTWLEILIFVLALAIGIFWQLTSNDRISNLLLQSIYVLSYIPTVVGLVTGRAKEHYASWLAAVIASLLATLSLLVDFPGDWIAFVSPIVTGLMGDGLVLWLVVKKNGFVICGE